MTLVLMYHDIRDQPHDRYSAPYTVSPTLFAEHCQVLKAFPQEQWRLTFDDGDESWIKVVAPLLAEQQWQAYFFVTADRIDATPGISFEALQQLRSANHHIGWHGARHIFYDAGDLDEDMNQCLFWAQRLKLPFPRPFSFPGGRHSPQAIAGLKTRGFSPLYGSYPGLEKDDPHREVSARVCVMADTSPQRLEQWLQGQGLEELQKRYQRKALVHKCLGSKWSDRLSRMKRQVGF